MIDLNGEGVLLLVVGEASNVSIGTVSEHVVRLVCPQRAPMKCETLQESTYNTHEVQVRHVHTSDAVDMTQTCRDSCCALDFSSVSGYSVHFNEHSFTRLADFDALL